MRKLLRRIVIMVPAVILQLVWLRLLFTWLSPWAGVISFALSNLSILVVLYITIRLQVFLSSSYRHSPSISANVVFRPVLSKKRDRVVHKSTFSVVCPVASDLSAIRFCPVFCAECNKKPDILRHPVSKIGRGDRI